VLLAAPPCDEAAAPARPGRSRRASARDSAALYYNEVIEACALTNDLLTLSAGDLTPLGDGGSSLSGGQAARLGLARCAFSRADVQLLDDPLSAVDPKVALHLFERCICGPDALMRHATRVLVTHQARPQAGRGGGRGWGRGARLRERGARACVVALEFSCFATAAAQRAATVPDRPQTVEHATEDFFNLALNPRPPNLNPKP
jgi:hypothetical protein